MTVHSSDVPHDKAIRAILIVSQSVFYVFIFMALKMAAIDTSDMMASFDVAKANAVRLGFIYLGIFSILCVVMIPTWTSYDHPLAVSLLTFGTIIALVGGQLVRMKKEGTAPVFSVNNKRSPKPTDTKPKTTPTPAKTPSIFGAPSKSTNSMNDMFV